MASHHTIEIEPGSAALRKGGAPRSSALHARLVGLARKGDRASFDQLVEAHREALRSFLAQKVEASEVEDVIQDVLVAAWRAVPGYDGRSQFRTWLFAIAFNKVRDHYRLKSRRVAEAQPQDLESAPQADDPFAAKDLSLVVRELLRKLPETQSEVVLLYYQDQLTLSEIGTVLNRNLSTVKYQFFQAHAKLADMIRESPEWSSALAPRKRGGKPRR
jgi:RNA polymerase sigma-70 factor, ECF subfamily